MAAISSRPQCVDMSPLAPEHTISLLQGTSTCLPTHIYSISKEICTRFAVLCFVVVMQSFIMNLHEVFIHIHQGCFPGTWAIVRLPQCQWSKPGGYGKISQCITTTKHSKAKPCAYFLGYTVCSAADLASQSRSSSTQEVMPHIHLKNVPFLSSTVHILNVSVIHLDKCNAGKWVHNSLCSLTTHAIKY